MTEHTSRRIIKNTSIDWNTGIATVSVMVKQPGESSGTIIGAFQVDNSKKSAYTVEEQHQIDMANKLLVDNSMEEMTEVEERKYISPLSVINGVVVKEIASTDELARLAGYKIENKITYL